MSELRLYTFVNFYLSQIQQGIQTAHIVSELLHDRAHTLSREWAENHKTIIVCNGGNRTALDEMIAIFQARSNPFPWVEFYEDEDSLSGALTAVGIVLPEEIYDAKYNPDTGDYVWSNPKDNEDYIKYIEDSDSYTYNLIKHIKSKRLA